ncbi:hypothetical protein C5B96_13185 [Subtercola sp. Z020]|nr:hypothetical protein C5B96_13185 [Subtercola sp. Z020]
MVVAAGGCSAENPPAPSPAATGIPTAVAAVYVPNVIGLPAAEAEGVISSSGFVVQWSTPPQVGAAPTVTAQQPAGGLTAAPGAIVRLEVSADARAQGQGREPTTPRGLSFSIAAATCDLYGRQTSAGAPAGAPAGGPVGGPSDAAAGSWQASFAPGDATVQGDVLVLRGLAQVVPAPGRPAEQRTVECTVGGTDITPVIQSFRVR